jgi:hypothetical protein
MKTRSLVVLFFVLAVGLSFAACGDSPTSATAVSAVVVSGVAPAIGSTAQFTAVATLASGGSQDITTAAAWTSSNPAVATVSATGLVASVASGPVVITATYSGVAGTDSISVP